jgi:hypothetical protein
MKYWLFICVSLLLAFTTPVLGQVFTKASTPWPLIPDPPKAKVEWVSEDMRVNGVPTKILHFDSQASKEEVVNYYEAYWKKTPAPDNAPSAPAVALSGKETTVGRMHGPFYMMVRVKAKDSGSEGTISTALLLGSDVGLHVLPIPAPDNAKAVSVVEAADFGKQNKQVLLVSESSVQSVRNFYDNHLSTRGWKLLQAQVARPIDPVQGFLNMYQKGNLQLDLSVTQAPSKRATLINANLITYDKK